MIPAAAAARTSSARSRYSLALAVCAAIDGLVRYSEPLALSVPTSTAGGVPDDAPNETSRPRGRRLSREALNETLPIGS
jgi:hypothetical protein